MPSISIRKTIPILIIVPLVAAISLVGSLAIYYGRKSVRKLSEDLMWRTASHVQDQVESLMQEAPLINRMNANAIYAGQLDLQKQAEWWLSFNSQLQATTLITDIYFGTQQGYFIGSQKWETEIRVSRSDEVNPGRFNQYRVDEAGKLASAPTASYDYDPRIRDWYKAAKAAGRPIWSDVYVGTTTTELLITAAHPIYDQRNQLLGVLGSDMYISEIDQFLRGLEISKRGEVFILEQNGLLVASSIGDTLVAYDQALTEDRDDGQANRISAVESIEPLISNTVSQLFQEYGDLSLIQTNIHITRMVDGRRTFMAVWPFGDELGLEWLIVMVIPTHDFTGPLRTQALITLIFAFVVLAIAVGMAWLVGRWIAAPILQLHTAAVDVKSQTFRPSDIEHLIQRDDEIGQFADVFSEMAEIISEREESMEEQLKYLRLQAPLPEIRRTLALSDLRSLQQKAKVIRDMQKHK